MSCIEGLVRERPAHGEVRLKQALGTFLIGGMVRGYLPQTWTIMTDAEALTVRADTQGNIRVSKGTSEARDGEVRIAHDLLANGIKGGQRPPPGSYRVTFYSQKGKAAFEYLRSSFGL